MLADLDWDDIRVFLVLTRCRSLRAAAAELGVGHPALRRRLGALEAATGLELFRRGPDGLQVTVEGEELSAEAARVQSAVEDLSRRARAIDPELKGRVRVALTRLMAAVLAPDFADFAKRWPQIDLCVDASPQVVDLSRMEADVAIRFHPVGSCPHDDLAGRRAATVYRAEYGHDDCDSWIGASRNGNDAPWVRASSRPELPVRGTIVDPLARHAACAAGMGFAWLPCFVADSSLPRLTEPRPGFDVWVLVHPELRHSPRLRLFRDAMVEALQARASQFRGDVPARTKRKARRRAKRP
jgi:DNA-binding transcriptional LysR family regulator